MSDSAPSESSIGTASMEGVPADLVFNIGIELVEVTRSEQPIYLAPELRWGAAGHDEGIYGAPLDRLYGEEANAYLTGALDPDDYATANATMAPMHDDPVVSMVGLADGLILALPDEAPLHVGTLDEHGHVTISADMLHTPEIVTLFDFGPDAHASAAHMHEAWSWDLGKGAWVFDHHA